MRWSFRSIAAAGAVAAGLLGISSVYAQTQQSAPERTPAPSMPGMMQGGGMMPMMGMMQEMTEMMATCNKMMQTMMPQTPQAPQKPEEKKG